MCEQQQRVSHSRLAMLTHPTEQRCENCHATSTVYKTCIGRVFVRLLNSRLRGPHKGESRGNSSSAKQPGHDRHGQASGKQW